MFTNHISDEGLVSITYKLFPKLKHKKTIDPIKKWAGDWNIHIIKENSGMANKHIKRCLRSLIIREIQIKTRAKYNSILLREAKIKKHLIPRVGEDMEQQNLIHGCWDVKEITAL